MKRFFFAAVGIVFSLGIAAQSISHPTFVCSANDENGGNVKLSWTLGETCSGDFENGISTNAGFQTVLNFSSLQTAVRAVETNFTFQVFPNPFSGFISVETRQLFENVHYQIYDAAGKLVVSQKISRLKNSINTQFFDPGVYILEIRSLNGKKLKTVKIIKN